jgi:signal transduction histidine kinase
MLYNKYSEQISKFKDLIIDKNNSLFFEKIDKFIISISSDKIIQLNLIDSIRNDLIEYINNFLNKNISERRGFLNYISIRFVDKYFSLYPENEILKPFLEYYLNFLNEFNEEIPKILTKFFFCELRIIATNLKSYIPKSYNIKSNEIIENSIHILMSSTSDRLGNHLSLVEQKAYLNKKLIIKIEELKTTENCKLCNISELDNLLITIKELGQPLEGLVEFSEHQSKMFTSFKNEIKLDLNGKSLEFILNFVFKNGFKIKHNSTKIKIYNELSKDIRFYFNEYVLINSLYTILENAIEAKSSLVDIFISNNEDFIYLDITNNGDIIEKKYVPYLFDKCFTTKDNHRGMGLSIAKTWLEGINCSIEFIEFSRMFRIIIPIKKDKK